ncbi:MULTISPECIES: NADPH:quinone oxidoreductase family protein [Streptomyces]|uniref:NADPH:quinone oxidoreductase family protein n=1 Tax=Streptomyces TaxID=1883 RepID=UPI0022578D9D|nr:MULTISPECIES: NADPH:quinone oxidoreductase family protein [Streptomyces]MCX4431274.1 NADPH:quinone oxidoreductase family protein [Streptomyces mirabilis]
MFSGKAWRVERFGTPREAVRLRDMTWEEPKPGQVLIRVRTAGAGFPDLLMATGRFPLLGDPPFGLGKEATGEVVAVPPGSRFAPGDRVTGITGFLEGWGGYAQYTYLREVSAVRVPSGMTDEEAGGFPIAFRTAYAGLVERAPVEPGQSLLVLGAAGSSGAAAVQLGKALGATVIAVAGGRSKTEFCARHGADHVIDHRTEDLTARVTEITGGRGVDLIYDPVGGETAATTLKSIARGGRIAVIGLAAGTTVPLDSADLLLRNYSAVGVLAGPDEDPDVEAAVWSRLTRLAAEQTITTPVGTVHSFIDVPDMIAGQGAPGPGKSVVRVAG